jgi:hypothetical protein
MTKRGYVVSNESLSILLPEPISTLSSHSGRQMMMECGVSGGIPLHRAGLGNTDILGGQSLSSSR